MAKGNIKVLVRLRPYQSSDGRWVNSSIQIDGKGITVENREKGKAQSWTFKRCLDAGKAQGEVFAAVAPTVGAVCQGQNSTVFTYGVTGSGKTHTIQGCADQPGLIPLTIEAIFNRRASLADGDLGVAVSYLEIYNDDCYDLLGGRREKLSIMDDGSNGNIIPGLTVRDVASMEEFELLYNFAAVSRRTASTALNATSSRSHAVLSVYVTSRVGEELMTGQLCLADLAGSENRKAAGGDAERSKEGRAINLSLGALSKVIDAIRTGSARIPYRDSKLTRVLQPALGGSSSALLICCIAPGDKFMMDTINTLNFADRTKQVVNTASRASSARSSVQVHSDGPTSSTGTAQRLASNFTRPTSSSARRSIMPLVDATNAQAYVAQPRQSMAIRPITRGLPRTARSVSNKENAEAGHVNRKLPEGKAEQDGGIVKIDLIARSPVCQTATPADIETEQVPASSLIMGPPENSGLAQKEETDLIRRITQSLDESSKQDKADLCRQLLPVFQPMLGHTTAPTERPTTPMEMVAGDVSLTVSETATLVDGPVTGALAAPASKTYGQQVQGGSLDAATLAEIAREIAVIDGDSEEMKIQKGRLYCKKARKCLESDDSAMANKFFRLARACGGKNTSSLTSIIADIEVNGLEGKHTRAALKRPRETDDSVSAGVQDALMGSPNKKKRSNVSSAAA